MTHTEAFEIAAAALVSWEQANGSTLQLSTVRLQGTRANAICNAIAEAMLELDYQALQRFQHLFVDTATGINLDELANDHYDEQRNGATAAVVELTFTRTNTAAELILPAGLICRTVGANGIAPVKFSLDLTQTMPIGTTTVTASATSVVLGDTQRAEAGAVSVIESSPQADLTVTNAERAAGGNPSETDEELRDKIRQIFTAVAGSLRGIEKGALSVANVRQARAYEVLDANGFPDCAVEMVVSDRLGNSNTTMTDAVDNALVAWRGAGIPVNVTGGIAVQQDVTIRMEWRDGFATPANRDAVKAQITAAISRLRPNAVDPPGDANADSKLTPGLILSAALRVAGALATSEVLVPSGTVVPNKGELLRAGEVTVL